MASLLPALGLAVADLAPPLPPPDVDVASLSLAAQTALAALQDGPADVDALGGRTGLSSGELLAGLTELELRGAARLQPGRRYQALVAPRPAELQRFVDASRPAN